MVCREIRQRSVNDLGHETVGAHPSSDLSSSFSGTINSYEKQMAVLPCFASRARLEARGASLDTGLSIHIFVCRGGLSDSGDIQQVHDFGGFIRMLCLDLQILDQCKFRDLSTDS